MDPAAQNTTHPTPNSVFCKFCKYPLSENFKYCPNCGRKYGEEPYPTTITKQIYIYSLSILLPPFGIIPGIRYVLQKNMKTKAIGAIAILLTFVSLYLSIALVKNFFKDQSRIATEQLQQLENFGY